MLYSAQIFPVTTDQSNHTATLPGETVASRTLVRSIFFLESNRLKTLPPIKQNLQPYRRKFEMGNDQGQFRAVVIGFDPIDIVSIPL